MGLVGQEMLAPLATEFSRTFDEQNLGISLDEALRADGQASSKLGHDFLLRRSFFNVRPAVTWQEILDKIGRR